MASFMWMLLAEPSYKPNTVTALSLAGEESEPEDSTKSITYPEARRRRSVPTLSVETPAPVRTTQGWLSRMSSARPATWSPPHHASLPAGEPAYFSGFVPAIQMMTRENLPSASTSKKLQLCMSFFVPSASSPM
jgi:hypothetical protein